jgi:hypothetical protein
MITIRMNDSLARKLVIWLRVALVPALVVLTVAPGVAGEERSSRAAVHFARGVELAKEGDLESAASEFEAANELRSHPTVLYNLGQTYASLGRAVDVVRTLKRYLAESPQLPLERQKEAEQLIAFHRKRIGNLLVSLDPPDAELLLDGRSVTLTGGTPLEVTAGTHSWLVRKAGYQPAAGTERVRPQETSQLKVVLEPAKSTARAWLWVTCSVLDAAIYLDGRLVGQTPSDTPLEVEAGPHTLRFSRAGYEGVSTTVDARGTSAVGCRLRPGLLLHADEGAHLRVAGAPPQSKILVDGQSYHGAALPPGRHVLLVESPGYEGRSAKVSLPGGRTTVIDVELSPTPAQRRRLADEARSRRHAYALIGGGVGTALCGVAGVLYAVNAQRYADYSMESKQLSRQLSVQPARREDLNRLDALTHQAASIQRIDYLALTTGVLGAALLSGSIALYMSAGPSQAPSQSGMLGVRGFVW